MYRRLRSASVKPTPLHGRMDFPARQRQCFEHLLVLELRLFVRLLGRTPRVSDFFAGFLVFVRHIRPHAPAGLGDDKGDE